MPPLNFGNLPFGIIFTFLIKMFCDINAFSSWLRFNCISGTGKMTNLFQTDWTGIFGYPWHVKKMQWSFLLASKLGLLNQNFTLLDQTDQFSSIRICCLFQRKKTCPV